LIQRPVEDADKSHLAGPYRQAIDDNEQRREKYQ
jgi:hypothetical protein